MENKQKTLLSTLPKQQKEPNEVSCLRISNLTVTSSRFTELILND